MDVNDPLDRESILLGLLNTALNYRLDDADPGTATLGAQLSDARARLYPRWQNAGEIQCMDCLDTGLVCSQCGARPHRSRCAELKGILGTEVCTSCEVAESTGLTDKLKITALESALEDHLTEVESLRQQLEEAQDELRGKSP